MFGRKGATPVAPVAEAVRPDSKKGSEPAADAKSDAAPATRTDGDERLQKIKASIFEDLIESVNLAELAKLPPERVREEIADTIVEIMAMRNLILTAAEQQAISREICDEVLGLGPLEPLVARDDIADIMVNGADKVYIETNGRIELTDIRFRDNQQLMNICQRIVSAVGRRVDEASPICDARLADGSRVNVIAPPLAIDGPTLTIRKFKKEKLTLEKLTDFGSITPLGARLLRIVGASRINVIISGGTGSGKTTLLNCLTRYIDQGERIITCEDAAELQLQQPHVVRLETRPPNLEGTGEITVRALIKTCLRLRPDRIIVGETRGAEAFDMLQAMNTGHPGSMSTIHANSTRDALSRIENMVLMGNVGLPTRAIRQQVASAVDVVIQVQRMRDGVRRVTQVSEILGLEGETMVSQDLFRFEGKTAGPDGLLHGAYRATGIRPGFMEQIEQYGLGAEYLAALDLAEA